MNALNLESLTYTYPSGTQALQNISLSLEEGSSLAILGSNGAGKSTLLDLILGYKQQTGIQIFGKEIGSYGRKELGRTLALVPQTEHYHFSFTLLDYTLFGRSPYLQAMGNPTSEDADIAYQALEEVGLAAYADRSVT
ncbi:MAG: ABC transporter ATP-binding protein, partial [Sphaerochaeta sp.]|nr:ABC transporter ATP-binding protein [Sphaerochaeta sp.]